MSPEEPFDAWRDKWLAADPGARLLQVFFGAARDPRWEAVQCVAHELHEVALGIRDVGVAQAKLGWWAEELAAARAGAPRHPVTRRLGATTDREGDDATALQALLHGAARLASLESPENLEALLGGFRDLAGPLLRLETGRAAEPAAIDALALAGLARELRQWPRFAQPERARVPLDALARVGVNRQELVEPRHAAAAAAVVRALAAEMHERLAPLHGSGLVAARARLARDTAARARRAPERVLAQRLPPYGPLSAFALWRLARRGA